MKKSAHRILSIFTLSLLTLHSTNLWANDKKTEEDLSGGFFKIGLGYKFDQNPYEEEQNGIALFLSGRYQMENGLFVEASFGANKRREGLNIGYNFYNRPNWNFDVTTVQAFGSTQINAVLDNPDETIDRITVIEKRDKSEMVGLRATGNFGDTNMQFLVAPLLLGNDYDGGVYSSLWLAHSWQVKNWGIYASAGVEYRSEEIIARYFEPSPELQSAGFPAYDASSGFDFTLQMTASYPITQNILFESYVRYTDIADSITDSPIISITSNIPGRAEAKTEFGVLFSYVF